MYCSSVKYPIHYKYQNRQWLYVGTVGFLFINKNRDQGLKMLLHSPKLLSNYVDLLKMHIALNNNIVVNYNKYSCLFSLSMYRRASLLK